MASGKVALVVKIGGSTLGSLDTCFEDLVTLQRQGIMPVVIHGGGPVITEWMQRQGLVPNFVRGLRVTDSSSLEIVVAVLTGLINKRLVGAITALGGRAIGLSGVDGAMLQAVFADQELGYVGAISNISPAPILDVVSRGYIPVIAPVGVKLPETPGNESVLLNINGDTAAGHLAYALNAEKLVFMTDVEGVLDSSHRVIPRLTISGARALIEFGTAGGGMIPKLEACLKGLERVSEARIVDGRSSGALLRALSGEVGGTVIVQDRQT